VQYTIDGTDNIFYVYDDGRVTDDLGNVICEADGFDCLELYIHELLAYGSTTTTTTEDYKQFIYTIDGESTVYIVWTNGTVFDEAGNVICAEGGESCLEDYISN